MAHISRKQLKKDEFRDTFVHGYEAVSTHQKLAAWIVGIALLVGLAVFGWRFYAERQTVKASAGLDDAMKVFNARIRRTGEAEEPGVAAVVVDASAISAAPRTAGSFSQGGTHSIAIPPCVFLGHHGVLLFPGHHGC